MVCALLDQSSTGGALRDSAPSKKRYFYGLKIHLLVTKDHQPRPGGTRFFLSPGSFSDTSALEQIDFDLPAGAWVFADEAYTFYLVEDLLAEAQIQLIPERKKNSTRPLPPWLRSLLAHYATKSRPPGV